jgi:hypothetical protein
MGVKLFPSNAEVRNEWKHTFTTSDIAWRCAQLKTDKILLLKVKYVSFYDTPNLSIATYTLSVKLSDFTV